MATLKKVRSRKLRAFHVGEGLDSLTDLRSELQDMTDVLLGRADPPIDRGTLTLMEVADAYYARAMEITRLLQQRETDGHVMKGSSYYKFRTGELRTFAETAKAAADLGSRRLTAEQMLMEQERYGRETV